MTRYTLNRPIYKYKDTIVLKQNFSQKHFCTASNKNQYFKMRVKCCRSNVVQRKMTALIQINVKQFCKHISNNCQLSPSPNPYKIDIKYCRKLKSAMENCRCQNPKNGTRPYTNYLVRDIVLKHFVQIQINKLKIHF